MGFGFGGLLNSITGASHSAKQSAKYSGWLNAQNNAYQKEAMQNAHQWEVEDLKKAGLNPVLSAGGTGASTGGVGGSGGSVGMQAGIGGLSDIMNSAGGLIKLSSEVKNLDKDTDLKDAQKNLTKGETTKIKPEIKKIESETLLNNKKAEEVFSNIMVNSATALQKRMDAALKKEQRARIRKGKATEILGTGGFFDYYD